MSNHWIRNWGGYTVKEWRKKIFFLYKIFIEHRSKSLFRSFRFKISLCLPLFPYLPFSPHTNRVDVVFFLLYFIKSAIFLHREICWYFMCARCSIPNWRNSIKYLLKVNYVQTVWILFWASCFSLRHFVYSDRNFFFRSFSFSSLLFDRKRQKQKCQGWAQFKFSIDKNEALGVFICCCCCYFVSCSCAVSRRFHLATALLFCREFLHFRYVMWSNAILCVLPATVWLLCCS